MARNDDTKTIVQELASSTNQPEQLVSQMYAEALADFRLDAKIMDYVPLLAARRVRESFKRASAQSIR
ncbi:DUF3562 domain-containing protein [Paraburkholderia guartelaensis]|jgi:hypothetical protein|uniref:DUF3562 domain-containing protein n=1 Tax=Paraburkholderia guartelaensis TaxID=2546446 RepID=A0A4R5L7Q0_9BURK|nr:DUF3562 domain-containing protein [Paraburkholderia guartelaensis]TDG04903.1 DUF3562 domain-containing protein [Paraburkholderia guartelaensis]